MQLIDRLWPKTYALRAHMEFDGKEFTPQSETARSLTASQSFHVAGVRPVAYTKLGGLHLFSGDEGLRLPALILADQPAAAKKFRTRMGAEVYRVFANLTTNGQIQLAQPFHFPPSPHATPTCIRRVVRQRCQHVAVQRLATK